VANFVRYSLPNIPAAAAAAKAAAEAGNKLTSISFATYTTSASGNAHGSR
jgi:hypothetical protein